MYQKKLSKMDEKYNKIFDNMEWNALVSNPNSRRIESFNVFHNISFRINLCYLLKKKGQTKEEFVKGLRAACREFWSRCQYEVMISSMFCRGNYEAELDENTFIIKKNFYRDECKDVVYKNLSGSEEYQKNNIVSGRYTIQNKKLDEAEKIDVFRQLDQNMERLAEYIIKETRYKIK